MDLSSPQVPENETQNCTQIQEPTCSSGNCVFDEMTLSGSLRTGMVSYGSSNGTNSTTTTNAEKDANGGNANLNVLLVYLLIPFILLSILIPCILLKLRQCNCLRRKPVQTFVKPTEITESDVEGEALRPLHSSSLPTLVSNDDRDIEIAMSSRDISHRESNAFIYTAPPPMYR